MGNKAKDVDGFKWRCLHKWLDQWNGAGILVGGKLRELLLQVRRVNDRLMVISLVIAGL